LIIVHDLRILPAKIGNISETEKKMAGNFGMLLHA
jgi:hypothetical protein